MKVGIASLGEGGGFFGGSLIWDMEVGRSDRCFLGSSSGPNSLVWATVFGPERLAKGVTFGEAQEVYCVSSERQCDDNERND